MLRATTDADGGSGGTDALDDDGGACCRRHQMKAPGRERLDALRRPQRFDLEPQVPVDFLLLAALRLHLLEAIPMLQQLDALPA